MAPAQSLETIVIVGKCSQDGKQIRELTKRSSKKVLRKCDNCENEMWVEYSGLRRSREKRGDEKDYCKKCINIPYRETCIREYGTDNISKLVEFQVKARNTLFSKIGVRFPCQDKRILRRKEETHKKKYGTPYIMTSDFLREHNGMGEKSPAWKFDRKDMDDFFCFREEVDRISNLNYRRFFYEVNPYCIRRNDQNHLDHKFSVRVAWNVGVRNAKIVAHYKNLRIISAYDNVSKGSECLITLDELLSYSNLTKGMLYEQANSKKL